jgi:hypothetical protein
MSGGPCIAMTRFVAHPTPVGGQLNYPFDEGKDAGRCGMPAKVTSGSAAARLLYPNHTIDWLFSIAQRA